MQISVLAWRIFFFFFYAVSTKLSVFIIPYFFLKKNPVYFSGDVYRCSSSLHYSYYRRDCNYKISPRSNPEKLRWSLFYSAVWVQRTELFELANTSWFLPAISEYLLGCWNESFRVFFCVCVKFLKFPIRFLKLNAYGVFSMLSLCY